MDADCALPKKTTILIWHLFKNALSVSQSGGRAIYGQPASGSRHGEVHAPSHGHGKVGVPLGGHSRMQCRHGRRDLAAQIWTEWQNVDGH